MPVDWTRGGPELLLALNRGDGAPLGRQLQGWLRDAIRSGQLEQGERLPASRALAVQLGVSRGIVVDSYAQLESEGYLRSTQGSGTVVASAAADQPVGRPTPPRRRRFDVDFEYGVPDLAAFPIRDWVWAWGWRPGRRRSRISVTSTVRAPRRCARCSRRTCAGSAGRAVTADAVVVCAGLPLRAQSGAAGGARTRHRHRRRWRTPARSITTRSPAAAACPSFPSRSTGTGSTWPRWPARRPGRRGHARPPVADRRAAGRRAPIAALVDWARRWTATSWRTTTTPSSATTDSRSGRCRVWRPTGWWRWARPARRCRRHCGSAGWSRLPRLRDAIAAEKQLLGRGAPGLDQLALAAWIESGRYDRHLRTMRAVYKRRRELLVGALARHAPAVRVTGLAAGCHAVLQLPRRRFGEPGDRRLRRTVRGGVRLEPLPQRPQHRAGRAPARVRQHPRQCRGRCHQPGRTPSCRRPHLADWSGLFALNWTWAGDHGTRRVGVATRSAGGRHGHPHRLP